MASCEDRVISLIEISSSMKLSYRFELDHNFDNHKRWSSSSASVGEVYKCYVQLPHFLAWFWPLVRSPHVHRVDREMTFFIRFSKPKDCNVRLRKNQTDSRFFWDMIVFMVPIAVDLEADCNILISVSRCNLTHSLVLIQCFLKPALLTCRSDASRIQSISVTVTWSHIYHFIN